MYEIKVSGMDCGSCASSLDYVLKTMDPDVEVSVDVETQIVRVKSSKAQADIASLIEEAGYPALETRKI